MGDSGEWESLYRIGSWYGYDWTRNLVDISAYAGQTVQLSFYFTSDGAGERGGWFIDDLDIVEGLPEDRMHEDFEAGMGGWSVDHGTWEVGEPVAGPSRARSGADCAGTNLNGAYFPYASTRLISPAITLDFSTQDGTYWLSCWHWFQRYNSADTFVIEIMGDAATWEPLHTIVSLNSTNWTRVLIELTPYHGQTVRIGFHFTSNSSGESNGWFIDDFDVFAGIPAWLSPDNFETSDWSPTALQGGWSTDQGSWEIGNPTSGPGAAFEGSSCAGTVLNGNYLNGTDSRLISPPVSLSSAPAFGKLWFTFSHWYSFYTGDSGQLEILLPDSSWAPITGAFDRTSGGWTQNIVDISQYAGQTVQFGFHLHDSPTSGSHVSTGWYVDKVGIVEGRKFFTNAEGFETRTRGWYADSGTWQIGAPTVGPAGSYGGESCAGTVLDANYPRYADSRLISPTVVMPPNPLVRFYRWFNLAANDSALFEISVDEGEWETLAAFTTSGNWAPYVTSLAAYGGQTVRFAFHLKDNGDGSEAAGWYVDDFEINGLSIDPVASPDFIDVTYSAGHPVLTWTPPAADSEYIVVYAGHMHDPVPDFSNRVAFATGTSYEDIDRSGWRTGYSISSVNNLWYESPLAYPGTVLDVDGQDTPRQRTRLNQNYPNPFNPKTTISFSLRDAGMVELAIFDIKGRKVATLVHERREAGTYDILFEATSHPSGVYFCRLKTGGFTETRKIMLMK
jgi:bacillopeptidase F (M6 metalloprotease family)